MQKELTISRLKDIWNCKVIVGYIQAIPTE